MVMRGGNASMRGQVLRNCWRGTAGMGSASQHPSPGRERAVRSG